jgi:TetR/AcrR family transcriptional regulator, acrAB operon repressor
MMARKTKQEAAMTRESLLVAARSVFSRQGYSNTTLEQVAQEAGVTRGAIYWHFGSKVELYLALLDQYSTYSSDIVQAAALQGGGLVDIFRRIFIRLCEAVETDKALREVMELSLFKTERTPELLAALQARLKNDQALLNGIAEVVRRGMQSGELRADLEPLDIARAFLAFQNGVIYMWLQNPYSFSLREIAPAMAEIFLNGSTPRPVS